MISAPPATRSGPGAPSLLAAAIPIVGGAPPPANTTDALADGVAVTSGAAGVGDGVAGALVATLGEGLGVGDGVRVGAAVGCGVGGAVGTGVGGGDGVVGGGVGVAAPVTMTVPLICVGWKAHTYGYDPGTVNTIVLPWPCASGPVSNAPVCDFALCVTGSVFIQDTVSPALTVIDEGTNVKLWIATILFAESGAALALDVPSTSSRVAPAKRRAARADTIPTMPPASAPFAALRDEAARIGLTISSEQLTQCERFAEILLERNTTVNLTAITDPVDVAHKHFLDSWTAFAARRWTGRERVIDVGSGAGFPGLALRIAQPSLHITLVESVGKKARFLEEVAALLGLADVEVRNERAEALARERRERYDVATARAVGTLGQSLEYLLPFVRLGGDAIVWKGRLDHELASGRKAAAALGGEVARVVATSELGVGDVLPGRNLVVARKTRATPARYPRSAADVKRHPW